MVRPRQLALATDRQKQICSYTKSYDMKVDNKKVDNIEVLIVVVVLVVVVSCILTQSNNKKNILLSSLTSD